MTSAASTSVGAAAPATDRDIHVLAFGDSLFAGYGLPAGHGFAPQLQDVLRREGVRAFVTNAGVSGDTSTGGRARLAWTLDGLKAKPDLVLLELGANDLLRGVSPAVTRANIDAMLAELARRKALARRFKDDPLGPRWSTAGGRERTDLVEFAQELKARWPIDRFLTELMMVELRPSGRNRWVCRCISPAHQDSEPSMTVYGDGHVYCFGCHYYGDVIDLTALHFGLTSFPDAVRKLAEATGATSEVMAS